MKNAYNVLFTRIYKNAMKYRDLREFIELLEQRGELKRIQHPIDPYLK